MARWHPPHTWSAHSSAPLTPPPLAQTYPHICLWIHHCLSPRWTALPTCLKHQFLAVCLTQSVALTSSVSAGAVDIIWKACGRRISDAIMAPARWDWEKPRIVSVRMAGPGVRTGHLRATRRQRYQLYNMLNRCVLHGSKVGSEKAYKPAILWCFGLPSTQYATEVYNSTPS